MVVGGGVLGLAVMSGLFAGILIGDRVAGDHAHTPAPSIAAKPASAGASDV
jgi:hypothetical protein